MGMLVVSPKTGREVELVGTPTGPEESHPEFGYGVKVRTFREDNRTSKRKLPTLWYHVPMDCRGPWKPEQVTIQLKADLLLTEKGYVVCEGKLGQDRFKNYSNYQHGRRCNKAAVNRTYFCVNHGGALHPLDRQVETADRVGVEPRTRQQKFAAGILHIEDMTDEELATKRFMDKDGMFRGRRPKLSQEVELAMGQELMRRLNDKVAKAAPKAIDSLIEVSTSDVYEGADRVRASTWLAERHMGKTAERVIHEQAAPWEVVFEGLAGGTRDDSRALREAAIDAEVVEPESAEIEGTRPRAYVPGGDVSAWEQEDEDYNDDDYADDLGGPDGDSDTIDYPDSSATVDESEELTPEERAQAIKDFKKRLSKAKGKRIWNREHGYKTVADRGYVAEKSENEDGTTTMVFYLKELK